MAAPRGTVVPSPVQQQTLKLSLLPDSMNNTPSAEAGQVPLPQAV